MAAGYSVGPVWWPSERARRTCCTSPGMSSVVSVLFAKGVEGRCVTDWGGLIQSIFHGQVFTVSEGTSFCERLYNFPYQPGDIYAG